MLVSEFKDNLSAMLHGNTLNKVRNIESLLQRAANTMLTKIDPIDTLRTQGLSEAVHNDVYNYTLPSDYKKIVDLLPQDRRTLLDTAVRTRAERFDLRKEFSRKNVAIEAADGTKIIRINWRSRQPKLVHACNSLTANGTWSVVGTASNLVLDTIRYRTSGGSLRFNVATTGDGIQNTTIPTLNLTDEDEIADFWVRFYINTAADLANLTSLTAVWGNDLTANFWTGVAQTAQADGTAFQVGWNEIKIPWSTATETGTVDPAAIDSFQLTLTVGGAITLINVDDITVSIGRNFDIKYYSKFVLKNTAGTWITKTTSDDDDIVLDSDCNQIYLLECVIAAAQQMEGKDSMFDISWAKGELDTLYKRYKAEFPSMAKKLIGYYGNPITERHWPRHYSRRN